MNNSLEDDVLEDEIVDEIENENEVESEAASLAKQRNDSYCSDIRRIVSCLSMLVDELMEAI